MATPRTTIVSKKCRATRYGLSLNSTTRPPSTIWATIPATSPAPRRVRSRRGGVRSAVTAKATTETTVTATRDEPVGELDDRMERVDGRQVVLVARRPVRDNRGPSPSDGPRHRSRRAARSRSPRRGRPCARRLARNGAGALPWDRRWARLKPPFCTDGWPALASRGIRLGGPVRADATRPRRACPIHILAGWRR